MRLRWLQLAALACLLTTLAFRADAQSGDKAPKVDYDKIVAAGPGVYKVEFDKQGRIQSCLVVGSSRISTVLGLAKGKEVARQRADLVCNGEFVKWLKTRVSVHQKSEDETILFLEGREGNDEDTMRESGKAVEKTTAKFAVAARGLVRGLQVVHIDVSSKEKTYTLVKRWRASTASAVKDIERDGKGPGKKTTGSKRVIDKKIEDKKVTIDD
jgi:hypothetical protein